MSTPRCSIDIVLRLDIPHGLTPAKQSYMLRWSIDMTSIALRLPFLHVEMYIRPKKTTFAASAIMLPLRFLPSCICFRLYPVRVRSTSSDMARLVINLSYALTWNGQPNGLDGRVAIMNVFFIGRESGGKWPGIKDIYYTLISFLFSLLSNI